MKYGGIVAGTEEADNYPYDTVYIDINNSNCKGIDIYFAKGEIPHNLKAGTKITININEEASP